MLNLLEPEYKAGVPIFQIRILVIYTSLGFKIGISVAVFLKVAGDRFAWETQLKFWNKVRTLG